MSTEQGDDLRATAEDLIADAEQLKAIEERKLQLDPDAPAVTELSAAAEDVARRIAKKAAAETELAARSSA